MITGSEIPSGLARRHERRRDNGGVVGSPAQPSSTSAQNKSQRTAQEKIADQGSAESSRDIVLETVRHNQCLEVSTQLTVT